MYIFGGSFAFGSAVDGKGASFGGWLKVALYFVVEPKYVPHAIGQGSGIG